MPANAPAKQAGALREQGDIHAPAIHVIFEGRGLACANAGECVTCHQSGEVSAYIGPSLRNLNRPVFRDGVGLAQLDFLLDLEWIQEHRPELDVLRTGELLEAVADLTDLREDG